MKKLLFLFAALCCMMVANAATGDEFTYNGIKYQVTSDKTVEVIANDYSGDVTIPATVTNEEVTYNVTSIGNNAFEMSYGLTSITIPETVTSIGSYAFNSCSELRTVTFAKGSELSTIGEIAFADCSALTSITIPVSVTTIGVGAFSGCSDLTSVTVFWTEEDKLPLLCKDEYDNYAFDEYAYKDATLNVPFATKALYDSADGWRTFEKKYSPPSFDLKVSSVGWASMYLHRAVKIPKYSYDDYWREISVSVYYASEVDGNTITLSEVEAITTITPEEEEEEIIIIPAKTGVIVKVEVDGYVDYEEYKVNFAESDEAGSIEGTNLFKGVLTDTKKTESVYVLSGASDEGNPQFQEYSGEYLNAFKAYLPMSAVGSGAKEISFVFGETTSINSVNENKNENENLYNLNGIRVCSSYKGIVIKNGKKMFNK